MRAGEDVYTQNCRRLFEAFNSTNNELLTENLHTICDPDVVLNIKQLKMDASRQQSYSGIIGQSRAQGVSAIAKLTSLCFKASPDLFFAQSYCYKQSNEADSNTCVLSTKFSCSGRQVFGIVPSTVDNRQTFVGNGGDSNQHYLKRLERPTLRLTADALMLNDKILTLCKKSPTPLLANTQIPSNLQVVLRNSDNKLNGTEVIPDDVSSLTSCSGKYNGGIGVRMRRSRKPKSHRKVCKYSSRAATGVRARQNTKEPRSLQLLRARVLRIVENTNDSFTRAFQNSVQPHHVLNLPHDGDRTSATITAVNRIINGTAVATTVLPVTSSTSGNKRSARALNLPLMHRETNGQDVPVLASQPKTVTYVSHVLPNPLPLNAIGKAIFHVRRTDGKVFCVDIFYAFHK